MKAPVTSCQCLEFRTYSAVKSVSFHPKALAFIREQESDIRREIGEALRDLQKGVSLGLPLSRPLPVVGSGVHELRVQGARTTVRVFDVAK